MKANNISNQASHITVEVGDVFTANVLGHPAKLEVVEVVDSLTIYCQDSHGKTWDLSQDEILPLL